MSVEYEIHYPGVYSEEDKKLLADHAVKISKVNNRGEVDKSVFLDGTIEKYKPGDGNIPGYVRKSHVTKEEQDAFAQRYAGENKLFTDDNYKRPAKYTSRPVLPIFSAFYDFMEAMPSEIGDYMVASGHNDAMYFYKPIYLSDTLYIINDKQYWRDITLEEGSIYRTFEVYGEGRVYNQKGEVVASGCNMVKESYRRAKNPEERLTRGKNWESPDWWHFHPKHEYVASDWEKIRTIWSAEKVRGADILYWEDVKTGDRPTWTCNDPVVTNPGGGLSFDTNLRTDLFRQHMLDPKIFPTMIKGEQGIYTYPGEIEDNRPGQGPPASPPKPQPGQAAPPPRPMPPPVTMRNGQPMPEMVDNSDERRAFQNVLIVKFATRALHYWMGDEGWLKKICWEIMPQIPGYDGLIPDHFHVPDDFSMRPYLNHVSGMGNRLALTHALSNDTVIIKSEVVKKYVENGEYLVSLIWWGEDIVGTLLECGEAIVKLSSKHQ